MLKQAVSASPQLRLLRIAAVIALILSGPLFLVRREPLVETLGYRLLAPHSRAAAFKHPNPVRELEQDMASSY